MSDATPLRLWICGRTATGRVRRNNEDNLWVASIGDADAKAGDRETSASSSWPGVLLAVADGMGGAKAGEVASRLAVETLSEELTRRAGVRSLTSRELREVGIASVKTANDRIRQEGAKDSSREGMGTTLTVAWVVGSTVELFQVGDSRAYVLRKGALNQLTTDQSLVGKLVEDGLLTEEEAERLPARHIILQALGSEEDLDVEHDSVSLEDGDKLLLCTDGLTGLVRNTDIEAALKREAPLWDQCARLIDLAEAAGGTDNITVVLARVGPTGGPSPRGSAR
jgi:PPM family protein phosphatase